MTIAFVCPDSFKDYEFAKRELSTMENIQNIICAASNATRLMQAYVSEYDGIKCRHEKRRGKEARIRRMIEDSDKVVLIEFTDYGSKKKRYSRTKYTLDYVKKLDKELQFIEYNRTTEPNYKEKEQLLEAIENFCLLSHYLYKERYKHPLSQAQPALRDDEEIVLFAVERYGFAFDFASRQLQEDKSTVIKALQINTESFLYAYEKLRKESKVLEVFQECELKEKGRSKMQKQNATYLFNQLTGGFHHSESRWSSIAQMAFIWLSQKQEGLTVFKSTMTTVNRENWLQKSGNILSFENWTSFNTIVEGNISKIFDKASQVNQKKKNPDIIWINEEIKQIVLIEVKTIGATTKHNLNQMANYRELVDRLKEEGWKCELYYLMPYGFEDKTKKFLEWIRLQEDDTKILLWEELFSKIEQSDIAPYIHSDLKQYTLMPECI